MSEHCREYLVPHDEHAFGNGCGLDECILEWVYLLKFLGSIFTASTRPLVRVFSAIHLDLVEMSVKDNRVKVALITMDLIMMDLITMDLIRTACMMK